MGKESLSVLLSPILLTALLGGVLALPRWVFDLGTPVASIMGYVAVGIVLSFWVRSAGGNTKSDSRCRDNREQIRLRMAQNAVFENADPVTDGRIPYTVSVGTVRDWFGALTLPTLGYGVLAGLGLFVLGGIGYVLTQAIGGSQSMPSLPDSVLLMVLVGSVQLVLAPALEELAFRGIVLDRLLGPLPVWAAVVLSAALFSLYHFSLSQLLPTFLIGLGLGLLMVKGHSLWLPLIAHAGYNLIGLILTLVTNRP